MEQAQNKVSDTSVLVTLTGVGLLAIPLLLMLFGGLSSPVPVLVCLPVGLGLLMWGSAKEPTARLGICIFVAGLVVTFAGMGTSITLLVVIGGIATAVGAFCWGFLKE
ncbi:hypothetical protein [Nitrospira sp. Nam74]